MEKLFKINKLKKKVKLQNCHFSNNTIQNMEKN